MSVLAVSQACRASARKAVVVRPALGCAVARKAHPLQAVQPPNLIKAACTQAVDSEGQVDTQSKVVFVGNLPWQVTEDEVVELFAGVAEPVNVRLMSRDGRPSGYGFVEFANSDDATAAMTCDGYDLMGRSINVQPATSRGGGRSGGRQSGGGNNREADGKTVFVRGFDATFPEEEIREELRRVFSQFGEVEEVRLPFDQETRSLRGFAYVAFQEKGHAAEDAAREMAGQVVCGGPLFLDPRVPPRRNSPRDRRGGWNQDNFQRDRRSESGSSGGGGGYDEGYGQQSNWN